MRTGHRFVGFGAEGAVRFAGGAEVQAGVVVLAMGGASWPRLGSDGGWVAALEQDGVAPLRPANCGFLCAWSEHVRGRFVGEPLKRIAASFRGVSVRGEAVLTADGIEGGPIYALSGVLREAIAAEGEAILMLDLRPDLDRGEVARRLGGSGVSMANALRRVGLSPVAAALVWDGAGAVVDRIKSLPLRLTGTRGIARAISSAGGVLFGGLNGLMLRGRPGVFAAGEMLDWDAPTGGYLLQACMSTGRAAGMAAAAWAIGGDTRSG